MLFRSLPASTFQLGRRSSCSQGWNVGKSQPGDPTGEAGKGNQKWPEVPAWPWLCIASSDSVSSKDNGRRDTAVLCPAPCGRGTGLVVGCEEDMRGVNKPPLEGWTDIPILQMRKLRPRLQSQPMEEPHPGLGPLAHSMKTSQPSFSKHFIMRGGRCPEVLLRSHCSRSPGLSVNVTPTWRALFHAVHMADPLPLRDPLAGEAGFLL